MAVNLSDPRNFQPPSTRDITEGIIGNRGGTALGQPIGPGLEQFDEHALSPGESIEYENMHRDEIVKAELGKGKILPLPKNYMDGDELFTAGLKATFGRQFDTADWDAAETSRRIRGYLDGVKTVQGNAQQRGTREDAIRSLRENTAARTAPLEAKRAQILNEMFGPENAEKLIALKELNPNQAAIALGAAVAGVARGDDPTTIIDTLAAPVKFEIQKRAEAKALRMKRLGIEYEQVQGDIEAERGFAKDETDFEQARVMEEDRTNKALQVEVERTNREDLRTDKQWERQAAAELGKIDDSKDPALALALWENAYGTHANPQTLTLARKLSERYGRAAEADINLKNARKASQEETTRRLKATFDSYVAGNKWDSKKKEVEFKAAAKGLEYLDREKALGIMKTRVQIKQIKEAMELAQKGDRRAWLRHWFGDYSDQNRVSDQEWDRSFKSYQEQFDQFLGVNNAREKLLEQIAISAANEEDTSKFQSMLNELDQIKIPVPERPRPASGN